MSYNVLLGLEITDFIPRGTLVQSPHNVCVSPCENKAGNSREYSLQAWPISPAQYHKAYHVYVDLHLADVFPQRNLQW